MRAGMRVKAKIEGRDAVMRRLRKLVPDAEAQLAKAQLDAAEDLADKIRARAPGGETGRYRASIGADRLVNREGVDAAGTIGGRTKDPNATGIFASFLWRFLEFGTKAHVIEPKSGKYLVFRTGDGSLISKRRVNHPGSVAHPHIFPTFRANRKKIRRRMADAVNRAVRKARGT